MKFDESSPRSALIDAAGGDATRALDLLFHISDGFPGEPLPSEQGAPDALLRLFAASLSTVWPAAAGLLLETLDNGGGPVRVAFFGEYGCALVCTTTDGCADASLQLLAPDEWSQRVVSERQLVSASPACRAAQLFVGWVPTAELEALLADVDKRLAAAQAIKKGADGGDKRSAAGGQQGHQKTASFIQAVIQDALARTEHPTHPSRGGLTDVGRHTGGEPRATAWPLARAVAFFTLFQLPSSPLPLPPPLGPEEAVLELQLFLIEAAAPGGDESVAPALTPSSARAHMLDVAAKSAAALADRGVPSDTWAARCVAASSALLREARSAADDAARRFALPPLLEQPPGQRIDGAAPRRPRLRVPPPRAAAPCGGGAAAARARAESNLGWAPLPPAPGVGRAADVLAWLGSPRVAGALATSGVEAWLFAAASQRLHAPAAAAEAAGEAEALQALVAKYRGGLPRDGVLRCRPPCEAASREALAAWAAFCLADRACAAQHPQLLSFQVPLYFEDLQWLSLSDGLAHAALRSVGAYMRRRAAAAAHGPTFSLLPTDATRDFAVAVGCATPRLLELLATEARHAAARRDAHWAEVQQKQALVLQLREKLREEEQSFLEAQQHSSSLPKGSYPGPQGDAAAWSAYQAK